MRSTRAAGDSIVLRSALAIADEVKADDAIVRELHKRGGEAFARNLATLQQRAEHGGMVCGGDVAEVLVREGLPAHALVTPRQEARSRRSFASSAQRCSSRRIEDMCSMELGTMPVSHSTGKVTRASACSLVPTPGMV